MERLNSEYAVCTRTLEEFESQKKIVKDELKELKQREQRLISDNNELEEENVTLQKQVSLKKVEKRLIGLKLKIRAS